MRVKDLDGSLAACSVVLRLGAFKMDLSKNRSEDKAWIATLFKIPSLTARKIIPISIINLRGINAIRIKQLDLEVDVI